MYVCFLKAFVIKKELSKEQIEIKQPYSFLSYTICGLICQIKKTSLKSHTVLNNNCFLYYKSNTLRATKNDYT